MKMSIGKRTSAVAFLAAAALSLAPLGGCSSNASQPDGGPLCGQDVNVCPAGTQCTNSNCVPLCDASGDCPGGFYCESETAPINVCSPISGGYVGGLDFTGCLTDADCPYGQDCAPGGICSSIEARPDGVQSGCRLTQIPDGCAPDSLCYIVPNGNIQTDYCVGLSHCAEDGGCPVLAGGYGAVCNQQADGGYLFAGKERLCLEDFCADDSHCPPGFSCFHDSQGSPVGGCQEGLPGEPCWTAADCFNSPTGCDAHNADGTDAGADDGGSLGKCY